MSEPNQHNPSTPDAASSRPGVTPSADIAMGRHVERSDEGQGYILCPYCGHIQKVADRCHDCGGLFEPLSRMATQIHMGPWFIRDKHNPFRPGCSYDVLVKQVKSGKVKRSTVLRGPSTCQFWALARNVPGIAHYLGVCHECNMEVGTDDKECSACKAKFEPPTDRNELGLMYRTNKEHAVAKKVLDRELAKMAGQPLPEDQTTAPTPGDSSHYTQDPAVQAHRLPGLDLLDEVVGKSAVTDQKPAAATPPPTAPAASSTTPSPSPATTSTQIPVPTSPAATSPPIPSAASADSYSVDSPLGGPATEPKKTVVTPSRSPDRTAPLPKKKKGFDKVVVAWIIINIIAFGAVIAAVVVLMGDNDSDESSMAPPSDRMEDKYAPQPIADEEVTLFDTNQESINPHTGKTRNLGNNSETSADADETFIERLPEVSRPAAIMPDTADPAPQQRPEPQSTRLRPQAAQPSQRAAAAKTTNRPASPASSQPAASENESGEALSVADDQLNLRAAARLAQAKRLEEQGQYSQALALLEDAHGALPEMSRPASLDLAIMRIRKKIALDESRAFFGNPI